MGQQAYKGIFFPQCEGGRCTPESAYCYAEEITCNPSAEDIECSRCGYHCGPEIVQCMSKPNGNSGVLLCRELEIPTDDRARPREKRPRQNFKDGSSYDGQWLQHFRDGHGVQQLPGGARYEGQWLEDRYHGVGTYVKDGKTYYGEWQGGHAHGRGSLAYADGSTYEGEWFHDLQHGKGTELWTDGSKFVGQYQDGFKTGIGVFWWPDGTRYEGQMFKNELIGDGTCTRIDKRKYKGQWVANKMEGRGIFTWKDGKMYEGEYQNDLKHGNGVFVYADGRRYEGQWELGKMHGIGLWHERGKSGTEFGRKGKWKRGKFRGWVVASDELFSHVSTTGSTCSTMSNLELASLLSNSVLSDMTAENTIEEEDDLPSHRESEPTSHRPTTPKALAGEDKQPKQIFGKQLSSVFSEDMAQLSSLYNDSGAMPPEHWGN
jgi:hypothetical protein